MAVQKIKNFFEKKCKTIVELGVAFGPICIFLSPCRFY